MWWQSHCQRMKARIHCSASGPAIKPMHPLTPDEDLRMDEAGRVVTANLPAELAGRLDEIATRIDRSKSWIIRQAVAEWIAEED